MASSRVMASSASASPDLTRQSPMYSIQGAASGDPAKNLGSMSMDNLWIYDENAASAAFPYEGAGEDPECGAGEAAPSLHQGSLPLAKGIGGKTGEVWKEISAGWKAASGDGSAACPGITLEAYLERTTEAMAEDIRVPPGSELGGFAVDPGMIDQFSQQQLPQFPIEDPVLGFGDGVDGGGGGGRGGRGRKRPALDPADRAVLQRQKRMIKNRESAARSRERKQAYTVELESLVTQLEEEHARLLRELEEHNKQRLTQLLENLIPVTERRKPPPRALERNRSVQW